MTNKRTGKSKTFDSATDDTTVSSFAQDDTFCLFEENQQQQKRNAGVLRFAQNDKRFVRHKELKTNG
jgi:hypothetical protein